MLKNKLPRLALLCALLSLTGCVTLDQSTACFWNPVGPGPVAEVAALWADGVVVCADPMQGGALRPGFGGRVYLFSADDRHTLPADGALTVLLFDDQQPQAERPVPREVWTMDGEHLKRAYRKDSLGYGYDLWLPWNTYQKTIGKVALVVIYKSKQGNEIWGSKALVTTHSDGGLNRRSVVDTNNGATNVAKK
jgi:hypothetical protein